MIADSGEEKYTTKLAENTLDMQYLHSVYQDPILQRSEGLVNTSSWWSSWGTKDELRTERPALRKFPRLDDLLIRLVMLQTAPETFGGQCGPGDILVHPLRVLVPCA